MNTALASISFYGNVPDPLSVAKTRINQARKDLLNLEVTAKPKSFHRDASPSVTIRIDTPILRNRPPRQVISMTSKTAALPPKFFPTVTNTKPPLPAPKKELKPQMVPNSNRFLPRMSIAKRKLDRGATLLKIEPVELPDKVKVKVEREDMCQTKAKKYAMTRKAILYLREYALSVRSLLKTYLGRNSNNYSPAPDRTRPPLPTVNSYESYMRKVRSSNHSNNSTKSNSPEIEDKLKHDRKPPVPPLVVTQAAQFLSVKKEKKRRYTTPDEPVQEPCAFTKTTFDAIEKLAFEPLIK